MSSSKLTMIGMYNYDGTLFDGLTLPAGINKDVLIPEILRQCDEFEILYPNLDFLKAMIGNWSQKHYRTFEKWVEGLAEEFNPLHNYDRHEVYRDSHISNEVTDTSDVNKSISSSQTSTSSNGNTNRNVSAYDASTMQPRENENSSSSGNGNGVSNNESNSNGSVNRVGNDVIQHEAHLYGNIGVTTSTQMLEDFLRVERWNIYEHIAELFVDEFCIRVY